MIFVRWSSVGKYTGFLTYKFREEPWYSVHCLNYRHVGCKFELRQGQDFLLTSDLETWKLIKWINLRSCVQVDKIERFYSLRARLYIGSLAYLTAVLKY